MLIVLKISLKEKLGFSSCVLCGTELYIQMLIFLIQIQNAVLLWTCIFEHNTCDSKDFDQKIVISYYLIQNLLYEKSDKFLMALFFKNQKFHSTTSKLLIIYRIVRRRDSITATSFLCCFYLCVAMLWEWKN